MPPVPNEPLNPSPPAVAVEEPPPPPATVAQAVEVRAMEEDLKRRMDEYARGLEAAMMEAFVEKKRKAEEELDADIASRRELKRQQLEEEIDQERKDKEARLAILSVRVSEEQCNLDQLKARSKEMQDHLEAEAQRMKNLAKEPESQGLGTPVPMSAAARKEMLKEKLLSTAQRAAATPHMPTPATPTPSEVVLPRGAALDAPASGKLAPSSSSNNGPEHCVTDMRFSSSTHPTAWQFLYRLTRKEDTCDKEIYDAWHAGAIP